MAKRPISNEGGHEHPGGRTTRETIAAFAEDIGKLLGSAQAKRPRLAGPAHTDSEVPRRRP